MMPAVNPQQMTSLSSPMRKPGLVQPAGPVPMPLVDLSGLPPGEHGVIGYRMVVDNHVHGAATLREHHHQVMERDVIVVLVSGSGTNPNRSAINFQTCG